MRRQGNTFVITLHADWNLFHAIIWAIRTLQIRWGWISGPILITPCDYRYGTSHFNTSFHYRYGAISQVPRQRSQTWEQNHCFSDGRATITEREINKPQPTRPHAELIVMLSDNSFTICMLQAQHEIPRHVYKCSCATHGCNLSLHNIPETSQYPLPP
jgi:hypothetical protein